MDKLKCFLANVVLTIVRICFFSWGSLVLWSLLVTPPNFYYWYALPLLLTTVIVSGAATIPAWRKHWCETVGPRDKDR